MHIQYQTYRFVINFPTATTIQHLPTFFIRSVMGNELRKIACVHPNKACKTCILSNKCAYSVLFETPIKKSNTILPGRNIAPHPFILRNQSDIPSRTKKLSFELTLVGPAIEYFSYFFYTLKKGGEAGIFFHRMPFEIETITCEGQSLIIDREHLQNTKKASKWSLSENNKKHKNKSLAIRLLTPLRIKEKGKYQLSVDYKNLLNKIYYRMLILSGLYGELNEQSKDFSEFEILPKTEAGLVKWKDYTHYSARQKRSIKLGGLKGTLFVKGDFNDFEYDLLRAGELFHVGKNVGFGLGQIEVNRISKLKM